MKWLVFLMVLTGCSIAPAGLPQFRTVPEACEWVHENIRPLYDIDVHGRDYWQPPEETLSRRSGDCEDMAILLVSIISEQFGSVEMVSCEYPSGFHAAVDYNGTIYDPVFNTINDPRFIVRTRYPISVIFLRMGK